MNNAETDRTEELKKLFLLRYDNMREATLLALQDRADYDLSIPESPKEAYIFGVLAALQHLDYADVFWDSLLEEYANSIN